MGVPGEDPPGLPEFTPRERRAFPAASPGPRSRPRSDGARHRAQPRSRVSVRGRLRRGAAPSRCRVDAAASTPWSGATIWLPTLDGVKRRRSAGHEWAAVLSVCPAGGSGTVGPRNATKTNGAHSDTPREDHFHGWASLRLVRARKARASSHLPGRPPRRVNWRPRPGQAAGSGAAVRLDQQSAWSWVTSRRTNGRCCGCWAGWEVPATGPRKPRRVGGASRPAQAQWPRLFGRSPLTPVLELEAMVLAIEGRRRLWLTMTQLAKDSYPDWDIDDLRRRATRQRQMLPP